MHLLLLMTIQDLHGYSSWLIRMKQLTFFIKNCRKVQNKNEYSITSIRIDHGKIFDCKFFKIFCDENSLDHNFSAPRTP